MIKSLDKGKRFEREIAKFLTKITNVEWKRVPMSGAFSTKEGIKDNRFKGDVFTEDDFYKNIVVECKNIANKDLSIADMFLNFKKNSTLWKFIVQTEEEAGENGWILFVKFKRGKVLVVYDKYRTERINELSYLTNLISDYIYKNDTILNLETKVRIKVRDQYEFLYEILLINL